MATDIIKSFVFKNGLAEGFDLSALEKGVVYFIRTSATKADGYIYFNGKKYGTASELQAEMETVKSKMTLSADTYENAVAAAKDGNLGQIIYVTTDSYDYVKIDALPDGESATNKDSVPAEPSLDSEKYIKVGEEYYQLNSYQNGAYVVTGAGTIAPLSTSLPGGQDVAQAVVSLQGEVGTIKSNVENVTNGLSELSGSVVTISGDVSSIKTEIGVKADNVDTDTLWGAINVASNNVKVESATTDTISAGHIELKRNVNNELYGVMYYLDDDEDSESTGGESTGATETGGTEIQA